MTTPSSQFEAVNSPSEEVLHEFDEDLAGLEDAHSEEVSYDPDDEFEEALARFEDSILDPPEPEPPRERHDPDYVHDYSISIETDEEGQLTLSCPTSYFEEMYKAFDWGIAAIADILASPQDCRWSYMYQDLLDNVKNDLNRSDSNGISRFDCHFFTFFSVVEVCETGVKAQQRLHKESGSTEDDGKTTALAAIRAAVYRLGVPMQRHLLNLGPED